MAVYEEGFAPGRAHPRFTNLANYLGAVLSLALIIGIGLWGYKLIVRDVSGIPVVRAMEGDMRVPPANPGGSVAMHTGLAVNEVAASGEAGGPEDMLVLAPRTAGLAREDLEVQPVTETVQAPVASPQDDDIAALAAQLATLAPAQDTAPADTPAVASAPETEALPRLPADVPGVVVSPRPIIRPQVLLASAPAAEQPAVIPASEVAVSTASFPAGTNLVQLGAFPNPALAGQEWDRLQARFGDLVAGHDHFIEVSSQSGGTWYRLRASGFADRAEARRLCAALTAEGANCIAVVVN